MARQQTAKPVRFENPLTPDKKLRQIYTAMVEMRLLDEHLQARPGAKKQSQSTGTTHGEEAARVSTALSLGSGDLVADGQTQPTMALLLGAELRHVLARRPAKRTAGTQASPNSTSPRTLPTARNSQAQLQQALGAAAALKLQGASRVVLVYGRPDRITRKEWKRAFTTAAQEVLPVIFVALPRTGKKPSLPAGLLAEKARAWGLPGFPVDGDDAIALYRVIQESLLHARAGEGPAFLECVSFSQSPKAEVADSDPLQRLAELLLAKGVTTEAWLNQARASFARRLPGSRP